MPCSPAVPDATCEAACECRITCVRHSSANSEVVSGTATTSREPGYAVWGMVEKVYTPNTNQERFFSRNRASIRNQHPRNTCKHQRNPSAFSMKPRVYKPQKNGRQLGFKWRLVFSSLFSESEITQNPGSLRCTRLIRVCSFRIRAREGHILCYTAPYTAVYGNGDLVRG